MDNELAELRAVVTQRQSKTERRKISTPQPEENVGDRKEDDDLPSPTSYSPFNPSTRDEKEKMRRGTQEAHEENSQAVKDPYAALLEKMEGLPSSRSSEAAHIKFGAVPTAPQMSNWRTDFLYKCAAAHPIPKAAFRWASETEDAESYEELAEDGARYDAKFATMEAKIATGILEILHGDLRRKVDFTKTVYARKKPPQMITGREIV